MKEIIIVMGIQGAGKSTIVTTYTLNGYTRFNRDELGGNLESLNKKVEAAINDGTSKIVMDNTYGTKEQRAEVIKLAKKHGFGVKCVWMKTSIEDAQFNVSRRILQIADMALDRERECPPHITYGWISPEQVLGPDCTKKIKGVGVIPVIALFSYKKTFQKPTTDEGFYAIEEVEFERVMDKNRYSGKAILLDYDGTLRDTISGDKFPTKPSDIKILPNRRETLARYEKQGYKLLGVSNQSGVEKGVFTFDEAVACFEKTNELLDFKIDYKFCPHHSFPIRCFCRKPMPGLGVYFIEKYGLDPKQCIMVGNATSDKTFAERSGFQYQDAEVFFK